MSKHIDVLLLCALPASGKSEVRRYLDLLTPEECNEQFGIGHTVQLDDYPYVHMMRRTSEELRALGQEAVFFDSGNLPMKNPLDWGTLMELLNEDYHDLINKNKPAPACATTWLMERFDACRTKVGADAFWKTLGDDDRAHLIKELGPESKKLLDDKVKEVPDSLDGKTVVVEFARGGAHGSDMPLPDPWGYQYSLRMLCPEMLEKASILYIWVSPEESRRKNDERTDPNDPGSILNHGVPIEVMMNDYGCDDMAYLLETTEVPESVTIKAHGQTYHLPLGRFDNRVDRTTFIRGEKADWSAENVDLLQKGMREAFDNIFKNL
jgi:hypothetical protein